MLKTGLQKTGLHAAQAGLQAGKSGVCVVIFQLVLAFYLKVMDSIAQAISAVGTPSSEETLFAALTFISNNLDTLTQRVFFELPGGLSGNDDSKWDRIKALSEARCGCGNERVFHPTNVRTQFVAGAEEEVVISPENPVYIKPVGGDRSSTVVKLYVTDDGQQPFMGVMKDPFAPFVLSLDLFSEKGYPLETLADAIEKVDPGSQYPVLGFEKTGPICWIKSCDVTAQSITLVIDEALETFRNEDDVSEGHSHDQ